MAEWKPEARSTLSQGVPQYLMLHQKSLAQPQASTVLSLQT